MKIRDRLGIKFRITVFFIIFGITVGWGSAQYFGRNKVLYESFEFKILKTEHFDIYFYPEEEKAAQLAGRMAERWYARLSAMLNHDLKGKQPLILYSSSPHFQQTTAIPGVLGEGTGGVTEMYKRRIVLPVGASLTETDHVIGHELVHAFQFDMTSKGNSRSRGAAPAALRLPLWLIEGMAEYLSIGSVDAHTAMWMRDATREDKLPTIDKLVNPRYFPYRYGQSLWAYISGKWGDGAVAAIIKAASRGGDYEAAFKRILELSPEQLSEEWHDAMKKKYQPMVDKTMAAEKSGKLLFKGTKENPLNISPALSPDGRKIVFLSTKDLFAVNMYIADARSGKILRRLIRTDVDPHFESLQFIKSSGSWSTDGKRFALGAITRGQPALVIVNTENGKKEKEVVFEELGEILSPTWSPDGRYVAFSALEGGFSDLFLYDLESDKLKKLTDDPYADLYPAWSPDGRHIAFSTERFGTDMSILSISKYDLGLIDPFSGDIQRVAGFRGAKNINPQWSGDSRYLYFISDKSGISNVYQLDMETGNKKQLTNLYSGASGITPLSPALSVASQSNELAFCVYESGNYDIYSLAGAGADEPESMIADFGASRPDILPPREKSGGRLLGLLKNPLYGLPENDDFPVEEYRPKLKLDYISPPQMAIGVDRFGTYGGGGLAMFFSDMLGYHSLVGMFSISSRIMDSALLVGYQNNRSRFNWGFVAQRIPYIYGGYGTSFGTVYGEPAIFEQEYIFRQINYEISGIAAYPFSQVSRLELTGGYRYLDFDNEVRTLAYSSVSGERLINEKEKLPSAPGLNFGFGSLAYVHDTSLFGATSPILGESYRLEVAPYIGTINFTNVIADYRRYFMPVRPFTLAFRLLHFGRYGGGSEDDRLYPLYIGYENLIRGYSYGSFTSEEVYGGNGDFNYDQLFGSRILVANFEVRFPLLGVLGLGSGYYGAFPLEFNAFLDAGVAWTQRDKAWFLGGDRKPVYSTGVGVRMNLFGYMVLGLHYVYPINREYKNPYLQLTITPGF